jgi:hypothetical protein
LRNIAFSKLNQMAKLPDETLTVIFNLLRQLAEGIEEASATEWMLFEQYGETEATIPELEELQNSRERLTEPYSRLHTLLLRILESQPTATAAMLNLLIQTIEQAQAAADAAQASVREVKRNWNLP